MAVATEKILWPGWKTGEVLGRGSFGAVYEIERDIMGDVEKGALKVISIPKDPQEIDELYGNGYDSDSVTGYFQSHLKKIIAEYALMRKLTGCANIVRCDDVRYIQHDDGIGWDIFIKMELLTPLTKALPAQISEEVTIKLAKDMCNALIECKRYDIVHRDIKPQNILVSERGDYKLGDFGIAKTMEGTMDASKTGTPPYMAPEVCFFKPYSATADIYSLGVVLYWMLNERRTPFLPLPPAKPKASDSADALNRRLSGEPLPPPAHGSEALKRIVLKACAYDPKDRYQSAQEILDALESLEKIPAKASTALPKPARRDIWPGWETVRMIGRGRFSTVYEIQRNIFGIVEKAALKVISIPPDSWEIDELKDNGYDKDEIKALYQPYLIRIVSEYNLVQKISVSPNIINYQDIRYVPHDDGIGWDIQIKMELLTPMNKTLPSAIPEKTVIAVAKDICSALIQCKKHNIILEAIRPSTIFATDVGSYKTDIYDLGKIMEDFSDTAGGHYRFDAPEISQGKPNDFSTNIYSLGLLLYWMLNERRMPFLPPPPTQLKAGMEFEAQRRRFSGEQLPPPAHGSEALKCIVLKACAYDPKDRYSSSQEMLDALNYIGKVLPKTGGVLPNSNKTIPWPEWEVVRLIGKGGLGTVYEMQRKTSGDIEKAALKIVPLPPYDSDIKDMYNDGYDKEEIIAALQDYEKTFVAEYSLMHDLSGCTNVVNYDCIRRVLHDDGIGRDIFIKMELLTPLMQALPPQIPEETVIKLAKDICNALIACKRHHVVHRNINPQAIFVSDTGNYKLGDFAIAKIMENTVAGTMIGTYNYMAPEVYSCQPYNATADIYSLGIVLYWMLNERRVPFLPLPPARVDPSIEHNARYRRLSGEPLPPPAHGSKELKRIVLRACAYDPKDRYQSAQQMLDALSAMGKFSWFKKI